MFPTHRVHVDAAHWVAVGQPDNGNGEGGTGAKTKKQKRVSVSDADGFAIV